MRQSPQTYAVTIVCAGRERVFLYEKQGQLMVETLARYRSQGKFLLHAFAAMPDHLHVIVSPTHSIEAAVGLIKGGFSFAVRKAWRGSVWENGHYSHRIVDGADFDSQVGYIASNPARLRLVEYPYIHTRYSEMLDPKPRHLGG